MPSAEEKKSLIQTAKDYFSRRQLAYRRIFSPDPGALHEQAAEHVLRDLAKFCRANKTTFHQDQRIHAQLEGRREVWLRILEHLKLTPDEYWDKYGRES